MPEPEPPSKRRKVRKGTYSCWECRRRKIKCQFDDNDDSVCNGCRKRETPCISQEFDHGPAPPPDRRLAQRLGRLEELMEKLVNKSGLDTPSSAAQKLPTPSSGSSNDSPAEQQSQYSHNDNDVFENSAAGNAQRVALLVPREAHHHISRVDLPQPSPCPLVAHHRVANTSTARCAHISNQLHALFPPQQALYAITQQSPGAHYVVTAFYSQQDQIDGKPEPLSSLAQVPSPTSHPAILAKRLLQLAICLQQMPPYFDASQLPFEKPLQQTMDDWVCAASSLVTVNDDLVGCLEGLECLILQSLYQSDAGHLRKAWMTSRRALNMAQLMGIDRRNGAAIRSCDPTLDSRRRPSPAVLWFRINCSDRYLSLALGLSVGSRDNSFASDPNLASDAPHDKLGKSYSVIAGRIAGRNELAGSDAYALTQAIDVEIERAYNMIDGSWWRLPDIAVCCSASDNYWPDMSAVKLQVRHFSLLILLHLPYLLRDPQQRRYEYNRTVCMQASREVMYRFLEFRRHSTTAISGRHVDYSALIAAMTLLLGHLGHRPPGYETQRAQDRALAEKVCAKMHEMGAINKDRLCTEAGDTIQQLLPIIQHQPASSTSRNVHLTIPLLGTVNISSEPSPPSAASPLGQVPSPSTPAHHGPSTISNPPFSLSLDPFLNGEGQAPMTESYLGQSHGATPDLAGSDWPGFTADLENWALQGVDTSYWSMLNCSFT